MCFFSVILTLYLILFALARGNSLFYSNRIKPSKRIRDQISIKSMFFDLERVSLM